MPCMCGDSECRSCGTAQGTRTEPKATWFHIKLREKGKRAYWFLSGNGGMNRLRIHAAIFEERAKAELTLSTILADNPTFEGVVTQ